MAQKPDKFPDWATEEEIDEVSGQANFVEPPDFRKESGWTRREIPPRQWFNWLARKTGLWFRWVEDQIDPVTSPFLRQSENLADLNDANAGRDNLGVPYASEAEALAGEAEDRVISPLGLRQGLNADNAPPVFGVRAWGRFDGGRNNPFQVLETGNVASIVRDATGKYVVTFDTNMPDANYAIAVSLNQEDDGAGNVLDGAIPHSISTSGFTIQTWENPETIADMHQIMFTVVR